MADDVRCVIDSLDSYALSRSQNGILLAAFDSCVASTAIHGTVLSLLDALSPLIHPQSLHDLSEACLAPIPIFTEPELRRVLGYATFAQKFLQSPTSIELDIRVEGWKAYCLIDPCVTVLRDVPTATALLWTHDEAWAKARFMEGGADLGLCGQRMGASKFVSPCTDIPATKGKVPLLRTQYVATPC